MVDTTQPDFLQIDDEENLQILPLISVEFGEPDAEPAKLRRDLSTSSN